MGTPPALLPNTLNAAPAEIYGVELELTGQFDRLGFNVGVSSIHSEFTEDALLTDSQTNTNRVVPEGSTIPFAPEITASGGIQYEFGLGSMTLTPRVQVSYIDEQLATPFHICGDDGAVADCHGCAPDMGARRTSSSGSVRDERVR